MSGNKKKATSISGVQTLEEIGEFWDTHSLADHWEKTHEVEFQVRAERKKRINLEPEIYRELEAEARLRGVVPETLVNLWLAEKLRRAK